MSAGLAPKLRLRAQSVPGPIWSPSIRQYFETMNFLLSVAMHLRRPLKRSNGRGQRRKRERRSYSNVKGREIREIL